MNIRVHLLIMVYRKTLHESTGFSLNFMVFGVCGFHDVMMGHPDSLSNQNELVYVQGLGDRWQDAYDAAREHLKSSANRQKKYYNVRANEMHCEPGDLGWTMNQSRRKNKCPMMQMRWIGPFVVLKKLNSMTCKIKMNQKEMKIIHYDLLKPCEVRDLP